MNWSANQLLHPSIGKVRLICFHSLSGWYFNWSNVTSSIPAVIVVTKSSASFEDFQKLYLIKMNIRLNHGEQSAYQNTRHWYFLGMSEVMKVAESPLSRPPTGAMKE